jgi:type VII secretion protein EccE
MPSKTAPGRRRTARGRAKPPADTAPVPQQRPAKARAKDRTAGNDPAAVPVKLHPKPGQLGRRLRLQQLVLIEVAVALVAIGLTVNRATAIGFAVPAVALLVFALLPLHGRTLGEALRIRSLQRARRKEAPTNVPPGTDPALAPVLELDPALHTTTHATEADLGGGRPVRRETGIVGDGTFLTSVLLVQAKDQPLRPARNALPLPLDVVCSALTVDDITLESVQLVQHTQPAPAPHLPEQALATRAYQALPDGADTPALRLTWIALKLDPERAATAVLARGGGEEGARKALQRVTDQLAGRLNGAGFSATVLDERELISALSIATCANPLATTGRQGSGSGGQVARRTQESRRFWRVDDRFHSSYWISRWPQLSRPGGPARLSSPDLVNLVTSIPALASAFSLTARPGTGGSVALSGHVRVVARSEQDVAKFGRMLEQRAQSAGLGLSRLDQEQVPGLLATLPLGGTS